MEKRKPRGITADDSALTASAAWAWLQRRSGSVADDPPTPESDVSRTTFAPKPSRYKGEAMKEVPETSNSSTQVMNVCPNTTTASSHGNRPCSLLDGYEIERISRQLDYYIKSSHANHLGGDHCGRKAAAAAASVVKRKSRQKKKGSSKGFWLLGPNVVACGSSVDEVVEKSSVEYSRRWRGDSGSCGRPGIHS